MVPNFLPKSSSAGIDTGGRMKVGPGTSEMAVEVHNWISVLLVGRVPDLFQVLHEGLTCAVGFWVLGRDGGSMPIARK